MSYESPIQISTKLIDMNITDKIIKEIRFKTRIDISEEELIKALKYDRDQYDKGYTDAMKDAQIASERRIQLVKSSEEPKKRKTYMEDFFEKFPNAPRYPEGGEPEVCLLKIYAGIKDGCDMYYTSCSDCWNREMEE